MITLKEACQTILSTHPNKYIHVVNEYEKVYAFVLMNKGELVNESTGLLFFTTVDKETGLITDRVWGIDDTVQGDYKQYTQEDLENLEIPMDL